jgi:hypothetical protein
MLRCGMQYLGQCRIDGQRGKAGDCRWSSSDGVVLCGLRNHRRVFGGCERCPVRFTNRRRLIDGAWSLL